MPAPRPALRPLCVPVPLSRRVWRCSSGSPEDEDFKAPIPTAQPRVGDALYPPASRAPEEYSFAFEPIDPMFDREDTVDAFNSLLGRQNGASFVVAVGPPSTGKSTILKRLKQENELARAMGKNVAPMILVDCRRIDVSTPEAFANAARSQLGGWYWQVRRWLGRLTPNLPWVSVDMSRKEEGLSRLFSDLEAFAAHLPPSFSRPSLVVDEINMLQVWAKNREDALRQFIAFCVAMSKQEGKINIIFSSSDTFVFYWLADFGLRREAHTVVTVDNLGEDETRQYLITYLLPRSSAPLARKEEIAARWNEVFAVTGGNMGEVN
ncbi:hypothetical protein KFL_012260010, partial [Klebsormidium nitens]